MARFKENGHLYVVLWNDHTLGDQAILKERLFPLKFISLKNCETNTVPLYFFLIAIVDKIVQYDWFG